jgi:hypothetical protein
LRHPLSAHHPGTVFHLTRNYFPDLSAFDLPVVVEETPPAPIDLPIADRLMGLYDRMLAVEQRCVVPEEQPRSGVWEVVRNHFHGDVYRLLRAHDVQGFAEYMRLALRRSLGYGLGGHESVFNAFATGGEPRWANAAIVVDRLVSLGVAIGVLTEETSEQGRYGANMELGVAELVNRIQAHLGTEIWRPRVMGAFGVRFGDYVLDAQVPQDAYCAQRIKELAGPSLGAVCEIGGGFGGMAMQLARAGARRIYIFDLPLISLVQGWYLMKIFGPDQVGMLDESGDRRFVLMPYWEFTNPAHRFDMVFNRDSMPEMPAVAALGYIEEMARRRVPFLSINQETENESGQVGVRQGRVTSYMGGKSFRRRYRFPYWIRKGYLEELFEPQ